MSEADEIREALDALTVAVANGRWSAWDRPEAVRLKALAQLDSLTTRLHDEQVAHGYTKSEALAHFTRQKAAERSLTQAREALERIARVPLEEDDYVPDGTMQNIASEALATINEGDKHDWMVVGPHQAVQQAQCQRCGVMRTHRNRDEACPGVVRPLPLPPGYAATINEGETG